MRVTRSNLIILLSILLFVLTFFAGYGVGARRLHNCEQTNKVLHEDLVFAIKRGIIVESNLNLCMEKKDVH